MEHTILAARDRPTLPMWPVGQAIGRGAVSRGRRELYEATSYESTDCRRSSKFVASAT